MLKIDGKNVTFKSLMAGEVTISWANIKELHSSATFALLTPGLKLNRRSTFVSLPQGAVSAANNRITLKSPTTETTVPVAQVDRLIPTADFTRALQPLRLTGGWAGVAGGGVALVRATQNSTTFNNASA